MVTGGKRPFHWRGWTTFVVTLSFVVDTVSGVVLYVAPPGRIANWTVWKFWGLTKDQWAAVHTIFGYVLLIIVALHLYYNWNIFIHYLWLKAKKLFHLKGELALSVAVCLVIFLGSIWSIPPFSTVMNMGESLKGSWEQGHQKTPVARAEAQSLKAFAETVNVPEAQIVHILRLKGYTLESTEQTVGDIAKANNVSPSQLYEDLQAGGAVPSPPKTGEGSGMGRKTLQEVSGEQGLSLEEVLSRLKSQGIDAKPDTRLKDLGTPLGKTPTETLGLITGE